MNSWRLLWQHRNALAKQKLARFEYEFEKRLERLTSGDWRAAFAPSSSSSNAEGVHFVVTAERRLRLHSLGWFDTQIDKLEPRQLNLIEREQTRFDSDLFLRLIEERQPPQQQQQQGQRARAEQTKESDRVVCNDIIAVAQQRVFESPKEEHQGTAIAAVNNDSEQR
jgi:hypothetical protein